ncbi:MAG: hypothetical protein ACR5LF_11095 [Symbiopectobacterium sp.]
MAIDQRGIDQTRALLLNVIGTNIQFTQRYRALPGYLNVGLASEFIG